MAWSPISLIVPQYTINGASASGYVLKAYASGTSSNVPFATDSSGATQATSIALNANGFPEVSGNIVIPHIDQTFKLMLYPTQAAADADSGATWSIDGLNPIDNVSFGGGVSAQTANYALLSSDEGKLIYFSGSGGVTLDLLAVATAGAGFAFMVENDSSGNVTLDGSGAEQTNGAATYVLAAGKSGIVVCNGASWRVMEMARNIATLDTAQTITANKTMSGAAINFAAESALASAATVNIGGAVSNSVTISGTTTITAFDTVAAGISRWVRFLGSLTLTHSSALDLGGMSIVTQADDVAEFLSLGSGNWILRSYLSGDRVSKFKNIEVITASGTFTAKVTAPHKITLQAGGAGGGGNDSGVGGGGGGGGGAGEFRIINQALTAGIGYTVTIGAGGAAATGGGDTTFDATSVLGGNNGIHASTTTGGNGGSAGGVPAGGTGNVAGSAGGAISGGGGAGGNGTGDVATDIGGGGGGGGSSSMGRGGAGGNGGNEATSPTSGAAGGGYGAGGGGGGGRGNSTTSSASGGAGSPGIIIVEW